jgi:hypothetical protein
LTARAAGWKVQAGRQVKAVASSAKWSAAGATVGRHLLDLTAQRIALSLSERLGVLFDSSLHPANPLGEARPCLPSDGTPTLPWSGLALMGNAQSLTRTGGALDSFVAELGPDLVFDQRCARLVLRAWPLADSRSLGSARFLKTVKCAHRNGFVVVKIFIKPDPGLSLRSYSKRLKGVWAGVEALSSLSDAVAQPSVRRSWIYRTCTAIRPSLRRSAPDTSCDNGSPLIFTTV